MPTYDSRNGQPVTAITVDLPDGLDVRRVIVRHSEVSLFDCEDRESVLIAQPGHLGAGLSVNFADHVRTDGS